ncbi:hypothetical protein ASNO1_62450 [Corallococcus caeni]|uniref:Uncharacterized protein n=1 Tax=Corallococcus caeni TaxID=3082388 RepID=A0ABQ6R257_9BACT|nr:hypothetical protein ASNO1_62450 [Corallococcus sp. NO1]
MSDGWDTGAAPFTLVFAPPCQKTANPFREVSVFRSAKKTGQVVLAVAAGFVMSFGATQAVSSPDATPLMHDCPNQCEAECAEYGYPHGFCFNDGSCGCYF